jgi:hypothetical protein
MPIEIRELNIRIHVNQNQPEQGTPPSAAPVAAGNQPIPEKDELIAECIEQVMELLKFKQER